MDVWSPSPSCALYPLSQSPGQCFGPPPGRFMWLCHTRLPPPLLLGPGQRLDASFLKLIQGGQAFKMPPGTSVWGWGHLFAVWTARDPRVDLGQLGIWGGENRDWTEL